MRLILKTTYLTRQAKFASDKYGGSNVMISSFTRAAAVEIAERTTGIPHSNVGTLHSFAFRALEGPEIAQAHMQDWNKRYRHWAVGGAGIDLDDAGFDPFAGATDGERLLVQCDNLRNRRIPEEAWPKMTRAFYKAWCDWKDEEGFVDFTDLIEMALEETDEAPGNPRVMMIDEAQDNSVLENALLRKWAKQTDTTVAVGDDDQCLYLFRGVTTDSFLGWEVPDSNVKVLSQSYRVPARIHALAVAWIKRVANRAEKNYEPREGAEGTVDVTHGRWNGGEKTLVDLAEETASNDQTVMILASCGFMLDPIIHELRDRGLPYHNPYRVKRGDWNPLGTRRGTSIVDRLLAYLRPDNDAWGELSRLWTAQDLKDWTDPLRAKGILIRGAKRKIAEIAEGSGRPLDLVPTPGGTLSFFEPDIWHLLMETDLDWWADNLLAEHKKRAAYPVRVAKQQGIPALRSRPRIVVGTIHSVKGAEADHVIICPDLSQQGMNEWESGREKKEAVMRQFYVGMTRARERLTVTQLSGRGVDLTAFASKFAK